MKRRRVPQPLSQTPYALSRNWSAYEWRRTWEFVKDDPNPARRARDSEALRAAYYHSAVWEVNRQPAWDRSKGRCEHTPGGPPHPADVVHHLASGYRHFAFESPDDLLCVCYACHDFIHHRSTEDPCDWRRAAIQQFWLDGQSHE